VISGQRLAVSYQQSAISYQQSGFRFEVKRNKIIRSYRAGWFPGQGKMVFAARAGGRGTYRLAGAAADEVRGLEME